MVYPKNGWLGMGIQSVMAAIVVAIFVMGCASSQTPNGAGTDSMVQTIGGVSVDRDGADSVVRLDGLVDPIYSVTTPDDPNVLVVDLVGVGKSGAAGLSEGMPGEGQQIAAYDGVVDLVTLSTFDDDGGTPLTRVEILMAAGGQAEVASTSSGLEIRVIPGDEVAGDDIAVVDDGNLDAVTEDWGDELVSTDGSGAEPWQEMQPAEEDAASLVEEMAAIPRVEVAPPPAASELTRVSAQTTSGGVLVALEADGGIGALEAFTLESPARLVIDLPGLSAAKGVANISVDSDLVKGVRVGDHDGKVRVVVDGGSEAGGFEGRQIMPGTTGLWVAIGSGEALEQAMNEALEGSSSAWAAAAAPVAAEQDFTSGSGMGLVVGGSSFADEPLTAMASDASAADEESFEAIVETFDPAPASASAGMESFDLAEVYGLHYERTEGMDRTAILADEAVSYTTSAVDPTTLVVSIQNAQISEEASDRIFPKAGGPISMIHAFQQPEVAVPEVRVVFTRAPNQQPVVSRRGSMLFIDFADMGVAAAPPPAFPNAGADETQMASARSSQPSFDDLAAADGGPDMNTVVAVPAAGPETAAPAAPLEVVSDLPGFDAGAALAEAPASMWDAPVAAAPAAVEVPAAIEVLEEGGLIDGKEYRGRRVSLDFKDVAIADVLRLIAEVSDLNIIAGDEVSGKVTIRLVEVPWDQALDVILMTKGLGFVRVGNVLRIAPSDVLKAEEEVRLQERRNKEKLEDLEVKLLPVNYASVKDTEGLVKRLLSARGTVNLDKRTNTLIIKDISSVIDEASALIAAIDTQTPQVMIEAKIVEANLDFTRELGSTWGIQTQQFTDPFDPDTPRRDLGSEDLTFIDTNSLAFANPITAVPTGAMTLGALILDQDFRVDTTIQAAESTGDGKVVSSPRIVTLDNKEARIEQGVSIPFQTFEGGDAKLEFIDAVLSLIVTPHITADESIIMEIEVTRNAPDGTVPTPTGSPAISKNVAETETLVKDGQTLVLGGIYTITKSKTTSRVPYLHRIPVIGNAFKNNSVVDSRKELLVFVTPRIVRIPEMASN